ncbi:MAG: endolytic transglycosylase MltG [Myxococcales bacterium]|nr:endolytic transglycosylase MltG [Myxococcales bacterium]
MSRLWIVALSVALLVAAIVAGLWQLRSWVQNYGDAVVVAADTTFTVEPGSTLPGLLQSLRDQQIITETTRLSAWLRQQQTGACLKAGEHRLLAGATAADLARELCRAPQRQGLRVTLREGLTRWEVADLLAEAGVCDRDAFLQAVEARSVMVQNLASVDAEGWLFPDTYEFFPDTPPEQVVERLVSEATQTVTALLQQYPEQAAALQNDWGVDVHELMALASLVEAEAAVADERALIARVFLNRLRADMRMQSDPTCTYTPELYGQPATPTACRDASNRWSTYTHDGLPPTPVNSPGRASIEAVLNHADDARALYFVAVGDGSRRHRFASSLAEHSRNVDAYREAVRAREN